MGESTPGVFGKCLWAMRLAIVEDDSDYLTSLEETLRGAGHVVHGFADGPSFIHRARQDTFDLVMIDWMLPGLSGIDLLKWVREHLGSMPVVMLTSRIGDTDIVEGLEAGADDYIPKPVAAQVLLARVNAIGRRSYPSEQRGDRERFGEYEFHGTDESASYNGERILLTAKEYSLALILFRNLSRSMSRAYLLESIWGRNPDLPTRTLDSHVSKIRSKLGLRPERGFRLTPIYSYGYRLEAVGPPVDTGKG